MIGAGSSLKLYWNKIKKFIEDNDNIVTFGCNNITDFLVPDYHLWNSVIRWKKYAHLLDEKSNLVFSIHFARSMIKKKWKGSFKKIKVVKRSWKSDSDNIKSNSYKQCRVYYKDGIMYGCFNAGLLAIFRAFVKKASKVSVVGLDGYTYYEQKKLKSKKDAQHCYGKGKTDGFNYYIGRKKDIDNYTTLNLIYKYCKKEYGIGFEILTPTVFDKFYNPKVLGITEKYTGKAPTLKEYKKLRPYFKKRKG